MQIQYRHFEAAGGQACKIESKQFSCFHKNTKESNRKRKK